MPHLATVARLPHAALGRDGSGAWVLSAPVETGLNISSFAEDAAGELYVTDYNGGLYRVTGGHRQDC